MWKDFLIFFDKTELHLGFVNMFKFLLVMISFQRDHKLECHMLLVLHDS